MSDNKPTITTDLIVSVSQLVAQARQHVVRNVNNTMVQLYWEIGRLIIEDEQQGEKRAEYGKALLQSLSEQLTLQFGKGFSLRNLRNMRKFYSAFPIRQTLSAELSWSHYNKLMQIEDEKARNWYMHEAVSQNWSVRALERQISVLYYERLLSSQEKTPVMVEAQKQTAPLATSPKDYLRDPYILDFLNVEKSLLEKDIEKSEAVAKYSVLTDSEQLFSAKYLPYLPTEKDLQRELQRERQLIKELGYE